MIFGPDVVRLRATLQEEKQQVLKLEKPTTSAAELKMLEGLDLLALNLTISSVATRTSNQGLTVKH